VYLCICVCVFVSVYMLVCIWGSTLGYVVYSVFVHSTILCACVCIVCMFVYSVTVCVQCESVCVSLCVFGHVWILCECMCESRIPAGRPEHYLRAWSWLFCGACRLCRGRGLQLPHSVHDRVRGLMWFLCLDKWQLCLHVFWTGEVWTTWRLCSSSIRCQTCSAVLWSQSDDRLRSLMITLEIASVPARWWLRLQWCQEQQHLLESVERESQCEDTCPPPHTYPVRQLGPWSLGIIVQSLKYHLPLSPGPHYSFYCRSKLVYGLKLNIHQNHMKLLFL
jgi:hypothetical protein